MTLAQLVECRNDSFRSAGTQSCVPERTRVTAFIPRKRGNACCVIPDVPDGFFSWTMKTCIFHLGSGSNTVEIRCLV